MGSSLRHRGPDDKGFWWDRDRGVYLAHRRLSIIDLSEHGSQPMASSTGRYVIVFNGEIYNYGDIKKELAGRGVVFHGDSDTEVLVNGVECWGIEATLKKLTGMFALALWDREDDVLTLVRDRIGEKPLYYGWVGWSFVFASELKAIRSMKGFANEISRASVASFMRFNYVPAPFSIFENIYKLSPGTYISIPIKELHRKSLSSPLNGESGLPNVPYWSVKETQVRLNGANQMGENEAIQQLDELIRCSVERQMIADVPLGAMLSGGIDSSTVVSVMQSLSSQPVKTFTIGFQEREYNEAIQAKEIANYLGTDHTELYLTASDALDVVPQLPEMYDEPFSDSSQIPTYLVSKLSRNEVTVALSGDGGDELFGGYTRYLWADRIWNNMNRVPRCMRSLCSKALTSLSRETWLKAYTLVEPIIPHSLRQRNAGEKIHTLARLLTQSDREALYLHIISHWNVHDHLTYHAKEHRTVHMDKTLWPGLTDFEEQMMYFDLVSYLPDDILVKLDRASMSVSLESRVPFLDHAIVEFASSIPLHYKIRNGSGKWILRKVLESYVPARYFERPKMGFGVPIAAWLKGPLREWAQDLLDPGLLRQQGYLNPEAVKKKWNDHLQGRGNWQYHLWDVLTFQAWLAADSNLGFSKSTKSKRIHSINVCQ